VNSPASLSDTTRVNGGSDKNTSPKSLLSVILLLALPPNGWRYPLVGGTRQRHFDGTNSKPHKRLENAQTPTSRVHAVLGSKGSNLTQGLAPK
jgi:hypothetical protein